MKFIYYTIIILFSLILVIFLIMPYGGVFTIWDIINDGFYSETVFQNKINNSLYFIWINKFVSFLFFLSILTPLILLLIKKVSIKSKTTISVICLIIILLIIFVPKII